jgi:hypothetical protein
MSTRKTIPDTDSAVLRDTGKLSVEWREFLKDVDLRSHSTAVSVTAPTNGQVLAYNSTTGLYTPTTPTTFSITSITAALGADVAMGAINNVADGPSIAQGTTGTWFVSGSVTVLDTVGVSEIDCKLWDGTTVVSSGSAEVSTQAASQPQTVHLCGIITSPAGNLRISCKNISRATGVIKFNQSGSSKDSSITAIRIA